MQGSAVEAAMEVAADSADAVAALTEQMESLTAALTPLLEITTESPMRDDVSDDREGVHLEDEELE